MQRSLGLGVLLAFAFGVAGGCADIGWLRRKPLPEALVDSPADKSSVADTTKLSDKNADSQSVSGKGAVAADRTKTIATTTPPRSAPTTDARESLATAIERLSSNPSATPQDMAELRRSLEQPDAGLPPLIRQQFGALLDLVERQRATGTNSDPVLLRPAAANVASPTQSNREPAAPAVKPAVQAEHDSATIATPHVTVNVHAGAGANSDAAPIAPVPKAPARSDQLVEPIAEKPSPAAEPIRSSQRIDVASAADAAAENQSLRTADWRERMQLTIAALQAELQRDSSTLTADERARLATYLRLLYVVADRHDAAVEAIESPDKSQQQFWQHQLHALVLALDDSGTPVLSRRAALALRELRAAADHLAALSSLDLRNLAFCTQVDGFGTFASFAKNEFKPDQEVLLYVEVENFSVEAKTVGRRGDLFETELKGSYQILDAAGRRMAPEMELPLDKQSCRSRRRDYFIAYPIYLPKKIEPGSYTLQLTIEDAKAAKFGQGSLEFKIKS